MKSVRTLRLFSLLGFLLLIAPFYDSCGKKAVAPAEEVMIDTTAVESPTVKNDNSTEQNPIAKDSVVDDETIDSPFYVKAYEFIDVESNQNAFELANISSLYFEGSFAEFKKELSSQSLKRVVFDSHKNKNIIFVREVEQFINPKNNLLLDLVESELKIVPDSC